MLTVLWCFTSLFPCVRYVIASPVVFASGNEPLRGTRTFKGFVSIPGRQLWSPHACCKADGLRDGDGSASRGNSGFCKLAVSFRIVLYCTADALQTAEKFHAVGHPSIPSRYTCDTEANITDLMPDRCHMLVRNVLYPELVWSCNRAGYFSYVYFDGSFNVYRVVFPL